MQEKAAIILIPGSGMSDWIWEDCMTLFKIPAISIRDRLDVNNYINRKNSSLSDCVKHIKNIISENEFDKYLVVGHSGAGPIAAQFAEEMKERVVHVIYVAANIPKHGNSTFAL